MAIPFSRSMRSLEADSFRLSGSVLAIAVLLLIAWSLWFGFSQVLLFEVSEAARVEVLAASHPVEAPVNARIVVSHVELGKRVERGDLLLELEAASEELQLAEEVTGRETTQSELVALRRQVASLESALEGTRGANRIVIEEREAQFAAAFARKELAITEHAMARELHAQKLYSDNELAAAAAEEKIQTATASQLELQIGRTRQEQQSEERTLLAEIENLQQQVSQLEGSISRSTQTEERLGVEVDKRSIRAAISGTLGDVAQDLRPGNFVDAGEMLCAIVPGGGKHIVAEFEPSEALGRIREGQTARLRLDGYSWTQYGTVQATVSRVASVVREGRVRVELGIDDVPDGIVLEHGLPGQLEVEVETASPVIMVLRSVGKLIEGA